MAVKRPKILSKYLVASEKDSLNASKTCLPLTTAGKTVAVNPEVRYIHTNVKMVSGAEAAAVMT